jgi:hypothetical protein
VRRRTGLPTKEFFGQDPPVEQDIFEHIGWRDHDDWFRVAEKLALSEYFTPSFTCVALALLRSDR